MSTVLFTDGVLANSITSAHGVLQEYVVISESRQVLEALQKRGARLGLVVLTRDQPQRILDQALAKSGLLDFFDPQLLAYSNGFNEHFLSDVANKAEENGGPTFFVGQHRYERTRALELGFDAVIPHPLLVSAVMDGERLTYARVSGIENKPDKNQLLALPLVPFHITPENGRSIYVIAGNKTVEALRDSGLDVSVFGQHDPQNTDVYLAHDDRKLPKETDRAAYAKDFLEREGKARSIVNFVDQAVLLALPSTVSIAEIHFPNARHGHNRRLLLDTALLELLTDNTARETNQGALAANTSLTSTEVMEVVNGINAATIKQFHAPYVGDAPLDSSGTRVESRHVLHRHNALVTDALCKQLADIGKGVMVPRRFNFDYRGKSLSNIVADLPGKDAKSFIIVSAHFDSTAIKSQPYDPAVDIAPGADDDASGLAAVLAIATVAVKLHLEVGPLQKSLRFILFNAEEDYIFGSKHYVSSDLRGTTVKINAVFQMDMIGYSGGQLQKEFELHLGCLENQQAEINALPLARAIASVIGQVSKVLNSPQIYPKYVGRNDFDPLNGRSDHYAFLVKGYPACVVTEDGCDGPLETSPDPRTNCDYHKKTDRTIDYTYAAEIARVVAAAAIQMAKG